jgi:PqqD family protein of HPr-rel-A system
VAEDDDGVTGAAQAAWIGCNAREVAWRFWGGETAVYHSHTGSTHLLTPLAGCLFRSLVTIECPQSARELTSQLRMAGFAVEADELLQCLAGLEAAGLVRSVWS